jgi:alanine dehydrogenase
VRIILEKPNGGRGILLGGVPGVAPGKVVILGGGVVGTHAAMIALGMGADVTVLDRSPDAMRALWKQFGTALKTDFSSRVAVEHHVTAADLVIGGVLIPGASAPKLVSAAMIRKMRPGSVVVDVAIDQGGCFETSRATTHAEPTYVVDGVVHYCVANMPGGVPHTSTFALNNATLPFTLALANKDGSARSPRMGTCAMALTWHSARSPARRSRKRSATNTCRQEPCCSDAGRASCR